MSMQLINKLIKVLAEHHCETTGQQMVPRRIKIGTPNNAIAISEDKTSLIAGICAAVAKVYCEENDLEMVGLGVNSSNRNMQN